MSQNTLAAILSLILVAVFSLSTLIRGLTTLTLSENTSTNRLGKGFFYSFIQNLISTDKVDNLNIEITSSQTIFRLLFGALAGIFILQSHLSIIGSILSALGFLILFLIIGELLPRIWSVNHPEAATALIAPVASLALTLCLPITYLINILNNAFNTKDTLPGDEDAEIIRTQLLEILQSSDPNNLPPQEKKMLESVVTFRDRIAREVMVPRVKLFSLSAETQILEAAAQLQEEGYSRVPVYRNNVDEIVGVLMYKDLLAKYMEYHKTGNEQIITTPIETLLKPILYTPETKKISNLLQEFRAKATHLAIVVDEYGGTEGLVTIEDILEEVVGEIADEYDEEDVLYHPFPTGGWIVDARMSINDIEDELGIRIPSQGDYDTLGGYIYHRAGSIPQKGFSIEHDDFEMEVVNSSDRSVEKVKLVPANPKKDES